MTEILVEYPTSPVVEEAVVKKANISIEKSESAPIFMRHSLLTRIKDKILYLFSDRDRTASDLPIEYVKANVYSKIRVSPNMF